MVYTPFTADYSTLRKNDIVLVRLEDHQHPLLKYSVGYGIGLVTDIDSDGMVSFDLQDRDGQVYIVKPIVTINYFGEKNRSVSPIRNTPFATRLVDMYDKSEVSDDYRNMSWVKTRSGENYCVPRLPLITCSRYVCDRLILSHPDMHNPKGMNSLGLKLKSKIPFQLDIDDKREICYDFRNYVNGDIQELDTEPTQVWANDTYLLTDCEDPRIELFKGVAYNGKGFILFNGTSERFEWYSRANEYAELDEETYDFCRERHEQARIESEKEKQIYEEIRKSEMKEKELKRGRDNDDGLVEIIDLIGQSDEAQKKKNKKDCQEGSQGSNSP